MSSMKASVNPSSPGSLLDADYPANGVLIPRRNTFRVGLTTADSQVVPELTAFSYRVDVPDRTDSFTGFAVPASGADILYASSFNGGPDGAAVPNLQITIAGASAGDDVVLSAQSLAGFSVRVLNGGAGVARSLNIIAQGY